MSTIRRWQQLLLYTCLTNSKCNLMSQIKCLKCGTVVDELMTVNKSLPSLSLSLSLSISTHVKQLLINKNMYHVQIDIVWESKETKGKASYTISL